LKIHLTHYIAYGKDIPARKNGLTPTWLQKIFYTN